MATSFSKIEVDNSIGLLELEVQSGITRIFVVPNINITPLDDTDIALAYASKKWHLLDIDEEHDIIEVHPFKNWEVHYFQPKYDLLHTITLKGFLYGGASTIEEVEELIESFPKQFVKKYFFGLGFKKEYLYAIKMLEDLGIKHLTISKRDVTKIDTQRALCTIKNSEFEEIRKSMDRVARHTQKVSNIVKENAAYNTLSFFLRDENYTQKPLNLEDDIVSKLLAKASPIIGSGLAGTEKKEALDFVARNTVRILRHEPEELVKLKNNIELVTLEELIERFEKMLQKNLTEENWQKLFNENPFILNMAFGYPVIKIQGQASVGGRKISGDGDKITDFLVKNNVSNNAAIIEIKTPNTKLLNKAPYRSAIFTPSIELTGAINQMLDQKHNFQKSISIFKDNSRIYDIETYSVHGVLIIGRSLMDVGQQKSFELFRGNSKDISIVTFDELLIKLKQLLQFISPSNQIFQ